MKTVAMEYVMRLITIMMIVSFSSVQFASAQADVSTASVVAADTSAPASSTPPAMLPLAPFESPSSTGTINPQDAGSVSVQSASSGNMQSAVTSSMLENTADPQAASSSVDTASPVPLVDASSTNATTTPDVSVPIVITPIVPSASIVSTSSADVVARGLDPNASNDIIPTVPADIAATNAATTSQTVSKQTATISFAALTPTPQYQLAITGVTIPATTAVQNADGTVTNVVASTESLSPVVDNTTGTVTVSGQCSDAYFVVLLFKNATDYAESPRSYIVNKAYPCISGTFTYSIAQLPHTLSDGTYYLMVAQEGSTGTWKPLTSLSAITINKNQQQ